MSTRNGVRLAALSFKECWSDERGRWYSTGGFPLQMRAIGSLVDEMVLVTVGVPAPAAGANGGGGIELPASIRVLPLRPLPGKDARRKLAVALRLPYYLWKIAAGIRGADVVHVPLPGDIPLLALFVALFFRKRTLVRYGGSWVVNGRTTFMNRVTQQCMRLFAGGRNVMLATGSGSEPPAPGISWIFSTALSRAELERIPSGTDRGICAVPRLIYVGRLSPEKGVSVLLRALASLAHEGFEPLPRLVLAGDGPQRVELEALACELGIAELTCFAGQLERAALSRRLAEADLCVQPSLTEGFSKAWLDAMAHGVPVLSSSVGAAPAVVGGDGERGWLVPPGDVEALSSVLRSVLRAPIDWVALRRRCRAYVEERTLEVWARDIGLRCAAQWGWKLEDGRLIT